MIDLVCPHSLNVPYYVFSVFPLNRSKWRVDKKRVKRLVYRILRCITLIRIDPLTSQGSDTILVYLVGVPFVTHDEQHAVTSRGVVNGVIGRDSSSAVDNKS